MWICVIKSCYEFFHTVYMLEQTLPLLFRVHIKSIQYFNCSKLLPLCTRNSRVLHWFHVVHQAILLYASEIFLIINLHDETLYK